MSKGIKGFQKGNKYGRKKGVKNKLTIIKDQRRAIFDEEVSARWLKIIKKLKPEYAADQYMGKAPDNLNIIVQKPIYGGKSIQGYEGNTKGLLTDKEDQSGSGGDVGG